MDLEIPYHFTPRDYQKPFLREVEKAMIGQSSIRNFMQIWHRRSGKDKTDIADCVPAQLIETPCLVKFVYPTLVMGRDNLWEGMGSDGFKYINHIAESIRAKEQNETSMKIPIKNGSLFQIAGSDNPDKLRGGNPKMLVFSEWAEQDPYAWDVVEPIMKENDGITIFNFTPKGDNHARALYEYAKNNPNWFVQLLTAEDTGIWTQQQLEDIQKDIVMRFAANGRSQSEAEAYFQQEYMCSFKSPVIGSYYGAAMTRAEKEGRVTKIPYAQGVPVDTFWDLGMDDAMSIWFMQQVGLQYRFIDYYENSGEGFAHYAQVMQDKKYFYGRHFPPHDIAVRELGTGKSRFEVAKGLGIKFEQPASLGLEDGINAVRTILSQCWFDSETAYRGINALKNYRKKWDEKNKVFQNTPLHDWASHGADSFRTFAVGYRKPYTPQSDPGTGGIKPYYPGIGF